MSQREAELHVTLLSIVLVFAVWQHSLHRSGHIPFSAGGQQKASSWLTADCRVAAKVSLLTNPLFLLTVNRSVRRCLLDMLARLHRRYSRKEHGQCGGLAELGQTRRRDWGSLW